MLGPRAIDCDPRRQRSNAISERVNAESGVDGYSVQTRDNLRQLSHNGLVPILVPDSANMTPVYLNHSHAIWLYRAKSEPSVTDHNPRVGGSSPSSGTPHLALECGFGASLWGRVGRNWSLGPLT